MVDEQALIRKVRLEQLHHLTTTDLDPLKLADTRWWNNLDRPIQTTQILLISFAAASPTNQSVTLGAIGIAARYPGERHSEQHRIPTPDEHKEEDVSHVRYGMRRRDPRQRRGGDL